MEPALGYNESFYQCIIKKLLFHLHPLGYGVHRYPNTVLRC